ncbi:GyrI-like domain-containing protein [Microlunatus panaciterrae]|uniref:Effector-binding domain-containing protein n=1 Tax=Microlunatus panaciterrae TaxID=400768 RepID=A0ABS2RJG0_9ACTN|nr:GyrI-like domain-containing protein [Microlunatus panaciterrae]MBM7798702.1 effector-binding domain-containing protein [Microlunatus panaciterrae]
MKITPPKIIQRDAQPYVSITANVTMDSIGQELPPLHGELDAWLVSKGLQPAGPPFWKYNVIDMAGTMEVEVGCPVAEPVSSDGRVRAAVLPAGRYATLTHTGHPSELMPATGALLDWAAEQGLEWDVVDSADGPHWAARLEVYLSDPAEQPDMSTWVTELVFKVAD